MKAKLTASVIADLEPKSQAYEVRDLDITGFLLRVLPTGSMTYFYQYRNAKGRQQNYRIGTVGTLKPRQARDIAESLAGQVSAGIDVHAAKLSARADGEKERFQTWGTFLKHRFDPWVREHRIQGVETLKRLGGNFAFLRDRPLADINAWVIEKWRTERVKKGVAKATLNRDIGDLKAALTKAVEWGLITKSPLVGLKPFKVDESAVIRYLTPAEERRLRDALAARDSALKAARQRANAWRAERGYALFTDLNAHRYADYLTPMVLLAKNTGLRRGELFHLRWADINTTTNQLTVRGEKAKSGQTRHIPLNAEARDVLNAWRAQGDDGTGIVFESATGEALTNIKNAWRGLLKKARIKDFRFHDLRHDFASKLVMAGVPLNTVRDLLGHTDLTTTLRYAHLAPDHKAAAVEKLN